MLKSGTDITMAISKLVSDDPSDMITPPIKLVHIDNTTTTDNEIKCYDAMLGNLYFMHHSDLVIDKYGTSVPDGDDLLLIGAND